MGGYDQQTRCISLFNVNIAERGNLLLFDVVVFAVEITQTREDYLISARATCESRMS